MLRLPLVRRDKRLFVSAFPLCFPIRKEAIYMEKRMISEILDSIKGLTVKELLELTKEPSYLRIRNLRSRRLNSM